MTDKSATNDAALQQGRQLEVIRVRLAFGVLDDIAYKGDGGDLLFRD